VVAVALALGGSAAMALDCKEAGSSVTVMVCTFLSQEQHSRSSQANWVARW